MTEPTRDAIGPDDRTGTPFRFAYTPAVVRFGTGSVADLTDELERHDLERALVVCGRTVGATSAVIDPVTSGLGDRFAGVFAETTPGKRFAAAVAASEALRDADADVIVSLGGGSSLDVAKVASAIAADERWPEEIAAEFAEHNTISVPDDPVPIVAVPTTLAGADLTQVAGITATPANDLVDEPVSGLVSNPHLMPDAVFYDPGLVATTPPSILSASAMNGFDKAIESLYASTATPITDATATHALEVLVPALHAMGEHGPDARTLEPVLEGIMLAQYGISRPDAHTMSIIHGFGSSLTRDHPLQQGVAHAIVAPHVLAYLFDRVDARRDRLAAALGVADAEDSASAIVDQVAAVRDALGLPGRLQDVDGPDPADFPTVARHVTEYVFLPKAPPGLDVTADGLESVLDAAW